MYTTHEIGLAEHRTWFERARFDPARTLLLLEVDGLAAGYISFARHPTENAAIWGFYAAPDAPLGTGQLLAGASLDYGFEMLGLSTINAEVVSDNIRSVRFHEKNGFRLDHVDAAPELQGEHCRAVLHYVLAKAAWQANRGLTHD